MMHSIPPGPIPDLRASALLARIRDETAPGKYFFDSKESDPVITQLFQHCRNKLDFSVDIDPIIRIYAYHLVKNYHTINPKSIFPNINAALQTNDKTRLFSILGTTIEGIDFSTVLPASIVLPAAAAAGTTGITTPPPPITVTPGPPSPPVAIITTPPPIAVIHAAHLPPLAAAVAAPPVIIAPAIPAILQTDLRVTKRRELQDAKLESNDEAVTKELKNKTSSENIQELKERSIGNPIAETITQLLQEEQLLYWLKVRDPEKFIRLIETKFDNTMTQAGISDLLFTARNDKIIHLNSNKVANRELHLPKEPVSDASHRRRTDKAAEIIFAALSSKNLLTDPPQLRFIKQIARIQEEMPSGAIESYEELEAAFNAPANQFREKLFKFYLNVYIQDRNKKIYSPYLKKLRDVIHQNNTLIQPVDDNPEILHNSIVSHAAAIPELRKQMIDTAIDSIIKRNQTLAVHALKMIKNMGGVAIQEWNTELQKTAGFTPLHAADDHSQLVNLYSAYRNRFARAVSNEEKNILADLKLAPNDNLLETLANHYNKNAHLSLLRRIEHMSARDIQNAAPGRDAKEIYVAIHKQRFLTENPGFADPNRIKTKLEINAEKQLNRPSEAESISSVFKRIKSPDPGQGPGPGHVPGAALVPFAPNTIGSHLIGQITDNAHPDNQKKGLSSLKELAESLPIQKQFEFLRQLNLPPEKQNRLNALYAEYCTDKEKADKVQARFEAKRAEYYRDIRDLKNRLHLALAPNEKEIIEEELHSISKKLKSLGKKTKEKIENIYSPPETFFDKIARIFGRKPNKDRTKKAVKAAISEEFQNLINNNGQVPGANWNQWIRDLFKSPEGYPGNFLDSPIVDINRKYPSKLDLRKAFENQININNGVFCSPKMGGANDPGEFGANYLVAYRDSEGKLRSQVIFFKQATDDAQPNHRENIAEVIAAQIMGSIIGDNAASAYFALKPGGLEGNPDDVYVASIFFDKYVDAHELAYRKQGIDNIPKRGSGKFGGQRITWKAGNPEFQPGLMKAAKEGRGEKTSAISAKSLGKATMASLLVGNYQIHSQNVGVGNLSGRDQFVILDFGGAFRRPFKSPRPFYTKENRAGQFQRDVNPHNESGKGLKYDSCYFLAYPESMRLSKEFIEGIHVVAESSRRDLAVTINNSIDLAIRYYGKDGFADHFAKELNIGDANLTRLASVDQLKIAAKTFLMEVITARQLSIREFGLESKLRNILQPQPSNDYNLHELIKDNPLYFSFVRAGHGLESLKKAEKEKLLGDLTALGGTLEPAPGSPELQLLTLLRSHINVNNPKQLLDDLIDFIDNRRPPGCAFDPDFVAYLKVAANKNYGPEDIGVVIQACDEAYRVVKNYSLVNALHPLPMAGVGGVGIAPIAAAPVIAPPVVTGFPPNSLGDLLLTQIHTGGNDAKNAIDTIFEISANLDSIQKESLREKIRTVFNIPDDSDEMIEAYLSGNQSLINNKFKDLCKVAGNIGPANVDKWREILNSFSFRKPEKNKHISDPSILRVANVNLFTLIPSDIAKASNLITDDDLKDELSKRKMHEWRYVAPKSSAGAQAAGPRGGWYIRPYRSTVDGKIHIAKVIFKQEEKNKKSYIESLMGAAKRCLVNKYAAATFLAVDEDPEATDRTYAASIAYTKFEAIHEVAGYPDRPTQNPLAKGWLPPKEYSEAKKKIGSTIQELKKKGLKGFNQSLIVSMWVADSDPHSANIGVGKSINDDEEIVCNIDHGGTAPDGLDPTVHPHQVLSNISHARRGEAPNQALNYDEDIRINKSIADDIETFFESMSKETMTQTLTAEITREAKHCESLNSLHESNIFRKYAKRLLQPVKEFVPELDGVNEKFYKTANAIQPLANINHKELSMNRVPGGTNTAKINHIRDLLIKYVPDLLYARALSTRRFAMEIKMSLCFKYEKDHFVRDDSQYNIDELIRQSPNYFIDAKKDPDRYHFRGHSNGERRRGTTTYKNPEIQAQIESRLDQFLNDQNQTGIRKLLFVDFRNTESLSERARCYIARLKLLEQLDTTASPAIKARYAELIQTIQDYVDNHLNTRGPHLTQLCDQAFSTIANNFERMPLDENKIKLYELFERFSTQTAMSLHVRILEDYATNPDPKLAGFTIENSAFTKELNKDLSRQFNLAETARYNANSWGHIETLEKSLTPMRATMDKLSQLSQTRDYKGGGQPGPDSQISRADRQFAKLKSAVTEAKNHRDHLDHPKQQLYFYKHESHLKPIVINLGAHKDAIEALKTSPTFENLFKADPVIHMNARPIAAHVDAENLPSHAQAVPTKTEAILCPNPIDKDQDADRPRSAALLTKSEFSTRMEEVKEAQQISLAYLLAEIVLKADSRVHLVDEEKNASPDPIERRRKDREKLQSIFQTQYVDYIQSLDPPQIVNHTNLRHFLERAQEQNLLSVDSLSIFRSLNGIAVDITNELNKQMRCEASPTLPNEKYLAWAYFWFASLKANPNTDITSVKIRNTKCNPKFIEALLILAAAEGANLQAANQTGYQIHIRPDQVDAYKKIINNSSDPTNNKIMEYVRTLEGDTKAAKFAIDHGMGNKLP